MITKVAPRTIVVCITVAILLLGLCGPAPADITLANRGQSDYTIVIDRRCSPSEQHGAEELQMFLEQICGAQLPISRRPVPGPMILVGRSKVFYRLRVGIDFQALGDEGFVIRTVGPHLVLAGGRLRGTMYACYELLDKYLGCRWFTPEISYIPHRETIELPDLDYKKIPVLEYREPFYPEALNSDWAARNRMNSSNAPLDKEQGGKIVYEGFVHTFYRLVPPDKYCTQHPEYFSEIDGQRRPWAGQLCLTNPEVVKIATETVRRWLRNNPQANIVSVSQNGYGGYCQCDKCRALAEREGSQAGPILHFVNQVADNIKDEFPDVAIDTLAYQYSRKPPKHVRPRPNVIVRLCTTECCFSHPLATCSARENRSFREDLIGWSRIANRLYVWDYVANLAHRIMPFPNLYSLQPNIKFFTDHNVKGIFEQGSYRGDGKFAELRSYVLARCLWSPDCQWQEEMDEFLQAYYGAAAGPIRQYIDMLHEKVQRDNFHVHIWEPPTSPYPTREVIEAAGELSDKAEAAVADDPVRLARVKEEPLSLEYVTIARHKELLPSWREYEAVVRKFPQVAKELRMAQMAEWQPLDERLRQWREDIEDIRMRNSVAQILAGGVNVQPLGAQWQFAIDPDDIGTSEKWFASSFNDDEWAVVRSDQNKGWERQGFPGYHGFGWYRQTFEVPAELEQRRVVYLYFGAVDEDAYIYLNGELVCEHSCASTGLNLEVIWETPFTFDVKPYLTPGRPNSIAVRVYNRQGMGGIWLHVYLIGVDREMDISRIRLLVDKQSP